MTNLPDPNPESVSAAMDVLERHFAALNAGDAAALAETLHFPHYRLAGVRMQVRAWSAALRTLDSLTIWTSVELIQGYLRHSPPTYLPALPERYRRQL